MSTYSSNAPINQPGLHTLQEILTQTEAWRGALRVVQEKQAALLQLWREGAFSDVLVTGCGSTYYLSLILAPLFQSQLGVRARALPASELLLYPETLLPTTGRTLLIAVSRSGTTSETIQAVRVYRERNGGPMLHIGCYPEAELAQIADLALVVPEGREESVVQTRSFSAMLLAGQALVATLQDGGTLPATQPLIERGEQLIASYHELARHLGHNPEFGRFYFLGSGLRYGMACEVSLKMKEMSLSFSEPFHCMEFRHGPMSMVNEHTLVVCLLSEQAREYELAVLRDLKALGGHILVLSEQKVNDPAIDEQIILASGLPESQRTVFYLPILQLLGYYRALTNGQDPDHPHNLTAVVVL
ncbi:SIS domain-containing protein [Ktedonosporobacter rubrisoli]|uniref:SIS domain-containing protein n=1 Tax=Ktedonosporobacter rubrisoli TaxID=2509675 RepID=A0A4P6JY15_KTERU|nr:SIS domain-containing protein [Ktedonosporobacter rubrisoli]QBD80564.1 SIS domain-containing protein [Ktedonosporobacter rubrisoli]